MIFTLYSDNSGYSLSFDLSLVFLSRLVKCVGRLCGVYGIKKKHWSGANGNRDRYRDGRRQSGLVVVARQDKTRDRKPACVVSSRRTAAVNRIQLSYIMWGRTGALMWTRF